MSVDTSVAADTADPVPAESERKGVERIRSRGRGRRTGDRTEAVIEDRWVDTHEAARIVGFSSRTLESWRIRKTGPVFTRAAAGHKAVRYRVSDLHAFMSAGEVATSGISG